MTHVKVTYTYIKEDVVIAQMDSSHKYKPIFVNLVTPVVKLVPDLEPMNVFMPRKDGI